MSGSIYSVKQVNQYIKGMFRQDILLTKLYVKGEISNLSYHPSGHIYFSLKDESGNISCVMFAGARRGLAFPMKNGDKVVIGGSVDIYEQAGKYQLYAKEITLEGAGLLYERFERLKQELAEMGMFAEEYKQPIPRYIKRLGVVTAPKGAVIQDIRNVAYRRNPYLQIILYPALVQGEGAKGSIVRGIQMLDELGVDTIIVGRGGGSIEDLWAFNEEEVARAIFECRTPIISAVGHETDTTIADFVADLRAPTPSAAAELAVDDYRAVVEGLLDIRGRLNRKMQERLKQNRFRLEHMQTKMRYLSPENQMREKRQYLMDIEEKLNKLIQHRIKDKRHQLEIYIQRLKGVSPLDRLNQGFSYTEDKDGKAVTRITQTEPGDTLFIHVSDGMIDAEVKKVIPQKRE